MIIYVQTPEGPEKQKYKALIHGPMLVLSTAKVALRTKTRPIVVLSVMFLLFIPVAAFSGIHMANSAALLSPRVSAGEVLAGNHAALSTIPPSTLIPAQAEVTLAPLVAPTLTVSPISGVVGTPLTFSGSNYAVSSGVTVSWNQGTACTATTSGTGTFTCTFTIPAAPTGAQTFTGTDQSSDAATTNFSVTPQLTASPTSGPSGSQVTFTLTGFDANECSGYGCPGQVHITWQSGALTACYANTNGQGSGSCTATIPQGTSPAAYTFTATDTSTHTATTTFTVSYTPVLTVSPVSGNVGTLLTFSGSSYAPSSPMTVSWNQGTACTATTSGTGAFTCTYTIPAAPTGAQIFTGVDGNSGSASASFTVTPQLTVNPTSGPSGTLVTFTLTGFDANECSGYGCPGQVHITWQSGALTACSANTNGQGSGSCTATIPQGTSPAAYTFTATDTSTHTATTTFTVSYTPVLTVSPVSGNVGTLLTFSGSSYAPSSPITVSWNQGTACTATTDGTGAFTCTFTIPAAPVGGQSFTGVDSQSGTASATFTVVPEITVSPPSGLAGTTVMFVMTGYNANDGGWSVKWQGGSVTVCSGGSTNAEGSVSCSYTIPAGTAAATYTFTGADSTPHTATTRFTVTYRPVLTVYPASGVVGTTLEFNGSDYAWNSPVTVTWGQGSACSTTTNATGYFTCYYVIPAAPAGGQTFTGTDAQSGMGTVSFNILPHLSASLTSVRPGSWVTFGLTGFGASQATTVTWQNGLVTACSPSTSGLGSTTCQYQIPIGTTPGSYLFTATDSTPNSASTSLTVLAPLPFSVAPMAASVGANLTFSGSGFAHGSTINVAWSGGGTVCTVISNSTGAFTCIYKLVAAVAGNHVFTATDSIGNVSTVNFMVQPSLTESIIAGPVGTVVTFTATGFAANSTIAISWSLGTVCSGTTNGFGSYGCSVTIGALPAGSQTFTAQDRSSNSASTTFRITPSLHVNPTNGPRGSTVTLAAAGFAASSALSIAWNGSAACLGTTAANGSYFCSFTIPLSATNGAHPFSATDGASNSASAPFIVSQLIAYPLSFLETGLPSGTNWSVSVNGRTQSSTGSTVTFGEPNATYSYVISASAGYMATPSSGVVVVSGAGTPVYVSFSQVTYTVTFSESGLPFGIGWSVNVNGNRYAGTTPGISVKLPNGTYPYTVNSMAGYRPLPSGGSVVISGAANVTTVNFVQQSYALTFTESSLPAGSSWGVVVNGASASTTNTTLVLPEANGTVSFFVTPPSGYAVSPASGLRTVAGTPVSVTLQFVLPTYNVTFVESGLQSGTMWGVNLSGQTYTTTGSYLSISQGSGLYAYTVRDIAGYISTPRSGTVSLAGAGSSVTITFAVAPPATFPVKFTENGLPNGTVWEVVWQETAYASSGTNLTIDVANGSYSYAIDGVSGYNASRTQGTTSVNGSPVVLDVAFSPSSVAINFVASGLPTGQSWSVTLAGHTQTSAGSMISFSELPGTYAYSVSTVQGYNASVSGGSIVVSAGQPLVLTLSYIKAQPPQIVTKTVSSSSSTFAEVLPGILAVVGALAGVIIGLQLRGKRNGGTPTEPRGEGHPSPPPQPEERVTPPERGNASEAIEH